ncbi:MAG: 3-isopropylmalate dehydratase small subunit [Pseudomonadota bacterium]
MAGFAPVRHIAGVAAPLLRANVDTDAIIPSREIKGVAKTGLAEGLFADWRYLAAGSRMPDPSFILNDPRFAHAPILLAGANFGCGSSREHAVWALGEYGVRAIVAPSFAPIFRGNCVSNGIIPVVLDAATILAIADAGAPAAIDLPTQTLVSGTITVSFDIDPETKVILTEGLDAIDRTLRQGDAIAAFHAADRIARPWVYLESIS